MRQLGLSVDIYCQNLNNQKYTQTLYLYRKNGEESRIAERQRERVCERVRIGTNCGGVHHKNVRWKNGPFWDKLDRFTSTTKRYY